MSIQRMLEGARFRQVAKVVLAALLAFVLSQGTRNEYAMFAMLGAAMVVGGSIGEDLKSSQNRVLGTLAGTGVGIVMATALGTSIWSLGLTVTAAAWFTIGMGWGAPAMRIALAMALVMVFAHTSDSVSYGLWRAFNTVMGVAIGLAVSRFVWPIRGRDQILGALDRTLAGTAAMLDALASGAAQEALHPRQVQVLDALVAGRTAQKDARLEQRVHHDADLLSTPTRLGARAAIAAFGASMKLDELARTGAPSECLQAVRAALVTLAGMAKERTRSAEHAPEFAARYERGWRASAAPEVQPDLRVLLEGLLADLRQIDDALRKLHEEYWHK